MDKLYLTVNLIHFIVLNILLIVIPLLPTNHKQFNYLLTIFFQQNKINRKET